MKWDGWQRTVAVLQLRLNSITNHLVTIISSIKDANNVAKEHMENISQIQKILDQTLVLAGKLEEDISKQ